MRVVSLAAAALIAAATLTVRADAQTSWVLTRNSVLRHGPSSSSARVASLEAGDIVTQTGKTHRSGYLRVKTQDEQVGWISQSAVTAVDPTEVHQQGEPAGDNINAPTDLSVVDGPFDGCAAQGNPSPRGPRYQEILALNALKNRHAEPDDRDIDSSATIDKLLESSSDDSNRWSTSKAAEITAYVFRVIPGGKTETTNCRKGDPVHRDTHVEIVRAIDDTAENRRVIVEVSPRWRAAAKDRNVDWSTANLQHTIEGHWVKVRGWLLFDAEHKDQAENTNPGNESNWRATAWEIHPITNLTIVQQP